jgi:hypothetical protein
LWLEKWAASVGQFRYESAQLETVIMSPRLAAMAAMCRETVMPASVLVCIAAFGSAGIDNTGAATIVQRVTPSLAANARFIDKLAPIALGAADAMAASRSIAKTTAATPAPHEPAPIVTAALTDPSETPRPEVLPERVEQISALTDPSETSRPEAPPAQLDQMSMATPESVDLSKASDSTEVVERCIAGDTCIDRYLWSLYQRTPKEDAVKSRETRKVTVRKKGKLVTVTKAFTTVTDEDFSWKDPKAAENAVMPIADYVIGGMDRDFKLKLSNLLRAADEAGLAPGITSAFRDDYRQSIASGLKAANDRSYHGGSSHGGYGHGLAADIVSVNGATRAQRLNSSEVLWKWVDAHGSEFGIGRPYLDRDPPHVAPIDGKEYASHHHGTKVRQQASAAKPGGKLALRDHRSPTKGSKAASKSDIRTRA